MTSNRVKGRRLMDVVQINARDCTANECERIGEFYYKLAELQYDGPGIR
jgi:hypothetical protein